MNKVVLIALVMTTLLVVDTECGWFRSKWESLKTKVKTAAGNAKGWVKKVAAGIKGGYQAAKSERQAPGGSVPCKDADSGCQDRDKKFLEDLKTVCLGSGIDSDFGLTREVAAAAFDESDENKDDVLDDKEIVLYEHFIEIYEQCMQMEQDKRK